MRNICLALACGLAALLASPHAIASGESLGREDARRAPTAAVSTGNLLPNGSFGSSLEGWTGYRANLVRLAGAVRVRGRAPGFSILADGEAGPVDRAQRSLCRKGVGSQRDARTPGLPADP